MHELRFEILNKMKDKIIEIVTENSTEEFNKSYGSGNFISSDALEVIAHEIVKLFAIPDVSQQRELLLAFMAMREGHWADTKDIKLIDAFLEGRS